MKTITIENNKYVLIPIENESDYLKYPFEHGDWVIHSESRCFYINRYGESVKIPNEIDYIKDNWGYYTRESHDFKSKINGFRRAINEEIINWLYYRNKIDFIENDVVWYKGENIKSECGNDKFKVLGFSLYTRLNSSEITHNYLTVNLENIKTCEKTQFLTIHLELYKKDKNKNCDGKIVEIDGDKYKLVKQ